MLLIAMVKGSQAILTDRQLEVLKLRRQGLTQEGVARKMRTSRENICILEQRAYRNIRRAKETLEMLDKFEIPLRITIKPKTYILDAPRLVLEQADKANLKMKAGCIEILEEIRFRARRKIRNKHVIKPIEIGVLPNGSLMVE